MRTYMVKELMVPISEYATVREGATLYEAVLALEKAQEEYDHTRYRHRAVLVLSDQGKVIGKLSHMDVLRAIEAQPEEPLFPFNELADFGFSRKLMRTLAVERLREDVSLRDLCRTASRIAVETFMQAPTEGEYVEPETSLELAVHQMVAGQHLSLLVARDDEIVGILRLTDAFAAIFHTMKECETDEQ